MKKIFILDDNELLIEQFVYIFDDYQIIPSASIHEAEQILNSSENFNLIILDESLPDGNGSSLIPYIRTKYPDINIIILTGYTFNDIPAVKDDKKVIVQSKNFKVDEFINTVHKLIA